MLPKWIVTTNMMVTVVHLDHRGPLRLHGRVLRRGRNAVVAALDIVDEGDGDREVASATMTSAVLEPGRWRSTSTAPTFPMPPPDPDALGLTEFFSHPSRGPGRSPGSTWSSSSATPGGSSTAARWPMLADVATCRAVEALPGHVDGGAGAWPRRTPCSTT